MTKVIAFYLPQFHQIPENDKWWGEGFTEWVNVKKAKPLFKNHIQPKIPLNNNYYDLSNNDVLTWQINLARDYGLYGFCFYHYWFKGKKLLEKPIEDFLKNKSQDFPFCLSWANEHWTNAWVSNKNSVLMEQDYGNIHDWKNHFNYLIQFFKDRRYIIENNKPVFIIYRPELIDCLEEMLNYWNNQAKENGFDGIHYIYQHPSYRYSNKRCDRLFENYIEYQPVDAQTKMLSQNFKTAREVKRRITLFLEKKMKIDLRYITNRTLKKWDYDKIWNQILTSVPENEKAIPGAFVNWDNTPRRGRNGSVYQNFTIDKFSKYFSEQIKRSQRIYKSEYLFIFAWNEWAEGGYIEPDVKNNYAVLEAIRDAIRQVDEYEAK